MTPHLNCVVSETTQLWFPYRQFQIPSTFPFLQLQKALHTPHLTWQIPASNAKSAAEVPYGVWLEFQETSTADPPSEPEVHQMEIGTLLPGRGISKASRSSRKGQNKCGGDLKIYINRICPGEKSREGWALPGLLCQRHATHEWIAIEICGSVALWPQSWHWWW